ncbi:phosphonate C-P lyase system protein PhnH [Paenibacillus sp. GCM10023248]|uniref:phosphonate C-P lyase system protein PhnH n=1 Tax=Bacillales TaxID=1385 RepID=UPI0023786105|nr:MULTISPECIES: phosphonate C-P lyase system protein PhnH [Bacillales]MDD9266743.1 phosphonate C-P lyase system protein PhnH [Paenibacillus sp. MAHUQ-63]MDR6883688.1 alpha-D-ribose 1-methylphosphonate 5-triphosphate synthase subunit PhnH [Bacillus sp. 3255]
MLDRVHDIQTAYRRVVDAMARPGTIADLSEEAAKLDGVQGCLPATFLLAQMLLDTEVTFKVVSEREKETAYWLSQLTYAKEAALEEADFIFVLQDASPECLLQAIEAAKVGELKDPHSSSTVIVESAGVAGGGTKLRFTGPGIQSSAAAQLAIGGDEWIDARAERNAEFPLGLDLMFTDASHRLLAVPRTTQVVKEEKQPWVM